MELGATKTDAIHEPNSQSALIVFETGGNLRYKDVIFHEGSESIDTILHLLNRSALDDAVFGYISHCNKADTFWQFLRSLRIHH